MSRPEPSRRALVRRPPTLFRKKTGFYYALFYEADRTPRRKWVALATTKQRAAAKAFARLSAQYLDGEVDPWNPEVATAAVEAPVPLVTLSGAVARFLADRSDDAGDTRPLAPRTIAARTRSL